MSSHSFNPSYGAIKLRSEQQDELRDLRAELKRQAAVPLDQSLVLVEQMLKMKTENLALKAHVKNMEARLHSNKIAVPLMKRSASPEGTP